MKPTINPDEMIADPKDDEVGRLLNAMGSLNNWTKERFALKNEIIKRMKRRKHVAFQSDKRLFQLSRVGSSLLYQVPEHKLTSCVLGQQIFLIYTFMVGIKC